MSGQAPCSGPASYQDAEFLPSKRQTVEPEALIGRIVTGLNQANVILCYLMPKMVMPEYPDRRIESSGFSTLFTPI